MQSAIAEFRVTIPGMAEKSVVRVSVDLPKRDHQKLFERCKFRLGNLSMNKRIIQLVQADNAGLIDIPHEPEGKAKG
jgi:hypothetical protein